jgi:hypothetical protein
MTVAVVGVTAPDQIQDGSGRSGVRAGAKTSPATSWRSTARRGSAGADGTSRSYRIGPDMVIGRRAAVRTDKIDPAVPRSVELARAAAPRRRASESCMFQGRPRSKRDRERARQDRQKQKTQKRVDARERRANTPGAPPGIDPDIAGIVPGPQANPWGDDLSDLNDEAEGDEDDDSPEQPS